MDISIYFPMWDDLTKSEQDILKSSAVLMKVQKGDIIHNGNECTGLIVIKSGILRAYVISDSGKEMTLYRLASDSMCLFSASCIVNNISFDIVIEAESDSEFILIPSEIYKNIMKHSVSLSNFTNELMAEKFSDVMWLMEQIAWKSFDKRLADFLIKESEIENSLTLNITHETIGNHMGNPREVVSRMLKYFQNENIVKLSRGIIEITDMDKLRHIAESD